MTQNNQFKFILNLAQNYLIFNAYSHYGAKIIPLIDSFTSCNYNKPIKWN